MQRILSSLTLYIVPMLNPDGAARFQRRNAQQIDVNRDALSLQTPEGRARWSWVAGVRLGHLRGSLCDRTVFL